MEEVEILPPDPTRWSREALLYRVRELEAQLRETRERFAQTQERFAETQGELAETQEKLAEAQEKLVEAQAFIAELQRQLFGSKAEKLSAEQKKQLEQLASDIREQARGPSPAVEEVLKEERRAQRKPRRRRHRLPVALETETTILDPESTVCPCCGKELHCIGEEVSEEFDLIPAKLIRRRTVRKKYACHCGEAGVVIAPLAPRLIPQSKLGLGLAVHIVLTRYDDHLSFYNLERAFAERYGVEIPRQQMVQWIEHIAEWLRPLAEALWAEMKAGGYLQIDETPVKVLDPEVQGKAAQGYLWLYSVPGGDLFVEFSRSRGQKVPAQRLEGFCGTIQSDGYEVYSALARKNTVIERIGCLAHARRGFYQALKESVPAALWFIVQIRQLYRLEEKIRLLDAAQRYQIRLEQAPPIWEALKKQAEELKPKLLPRSTLGKAVNYFLNDYDALVGYLKDGRFEIDNNLVENDARPTAVGRKRWLFIGHPQAGWRSAVIYSVLGSCRRQGLNPQEYLTDVLARLPSLKITEIRSLLPAYWNRGRAPTPTITPPE
jgi:transposase